MRNQVSFLRALFAVLALVGFPALFASCGGGDGGGLFFFPPADGGTRYSISGVVTDGTNGLADVTISIGGSGSGTIATDANGGFTISNLKPGSYTLTPSKTGHQFNPVSRTVTLPESAANADFTLTMLAQGDTSEGAGGSTTDNLPGNASPITIDISQVRTLYPDGDVDWVKVTLTAGVKYEISAYKLSNAADVMMNLYDCANTNADPSLSTNADYIGLDSRILYTPTATGEYCLKIESEDWVELITGNGIATYTLNIHPFYDKDRDNVSAFYDCEDSNPARNPLAVDTPGDGIDQDCTGNDALDGAVEDPVDAVSPGDDDPANARIMAASVGDGWEIQLRSEIFPSNARTIAPAGDVDVFSVDIPARSAINVHLAKIETNSGKINIQEIYSNGAPVDIANNFCNATLLAGDICQVAAGDPTDYYQIMNTGLSAKTAYIKFTAAGLDPGGYYVPFYYTVGQDADGDTYYTGDVPGLRDCDDSNSAVYPGDGC